MNFTHISTSSVKYVTAHMSTRTLGKVCGIKLVEDVLSVRRYLNNLKKALQVVKLLRKNIDSPTKVGHTRKHIVNLMYIKIARAHTREGYDAKRLFKKNSTIII